MDAEEYVSLAVVWDPPSGIGAHTRELAYWRVSHANAASLLTRLNAIDVTTPCATRQGDDLAMGPLLFAPYAAAQVLDFLVPYLVARSAPNHREGLCSGHARAEVVDGTSYGEGPHRRIDDEAVSIEQTIIVENGALVRPMGRREDVDHPTGNAFRDSHRVNVKIRPRALRMRANPIPQSSADLPIVHSLAQTRTGGGMDDGHLRFVARIIKGHNLVQIPMSTTARRLLNGLEATDDSASPFPLAHRVLGARCLFEAGTFDWTTRRRP